MKKIVMLFFLFFTSMISVNAEQSDFVYYCDYSFSETINEVSRDFSYFIYNWKYENGDTEFLTNFTESKTVNGEIQAVSVQDLTDEILMKNDDFLSGNTYSCPETLKYHIYNNNFLVVTDDDFGNSDINTNPQTNEIKTMTLNDYYVSGLDVSKENVVNCGELTLDNNKYDVSVSYENGQYILNVGLYKYYGEYYTDSCPIMSELVICEKPEGVQDSECPDTYISIYDCTTAISDYEFMCSSLGMYSERGFDFDKIETDHDKLVIGNVPNCEGLLGNVGDSGSTAYYLQLILDIMKYIAIIALIALSIFDFIGAVASQDADALTKAIGKVSKRLIYTVLLFIFPIVLEFFLELVGVYGTCSIG